MPLETRVEPIDRDIDLIFKETLSPEARSAMLAAAAQDQLHQAEQTNLSVLGRIPPHRTFVDGAAGASETAVRPEGTIVYEFSLVSEIFLWIAEQLKAHAPVGSGKDPHPGLYRSSFTFFADSKEVDVGSVIPADAAEYVFTSTLPYTRKIEQGKSSQASEGVFQVVADMARSRFGNTARIEFTYRGLIGLSSGSGTLVNPWDGRRRRAPVRDSHGKFINTGGTQAYDKSGKRWPCIVINVR